MQNERLSLCVIWYGSGSVLAAFAVFVWLSFGNICAEYDSLGRWCIDVLGRRHERHDGVLEFLGLELFPGWGWLAVDLVVLISGPLLVIWLIWKAATSGNGEAQRGT